MLPVNSRVAFTYQRYRSRWADLQSVTHSKVESPWKVSLSSRVIALALSLSLHLHVAHALCTRPRCSLLLEQPLFAALQAPSSSLKLLFISIFRSWASSRTECKENEHLRRLEVVIVSTNSDLETYNTLDRKLNIQNKSNKSQIIILNSLSKLAKKRREY